MEMKKYDLEMRIGNAGGNDRRVTNVRCHAIAFFQLSSVTAKSSLNNNPRSPGLLTAAAEDYLNKNIKAILGVGKRQKASICIDSFSCINKEVAFW